MMNRFKKINMVDRVPEEPWMEVCNIVQEAVTKMVPKKKTSKMQSGCLRRLYKWLKKKEKQKGK